MKLTALLALAMANMALGFTSPSVAPKLAVGQSQNVVKSQTSTSLNLSPFILGPEVIPPVLLAISGVVATIVTSEKTAEEEVAVEDTPPPPT